MEKGSPGMGSGGGGPGAGGARHEERGQPRHGVGWRGGAGAGRAGREGRGQPRRGVGWRGGAGAGRAGWEGGATAAAHTHDLKHAQKQVRTNTHTCGASLIIPKSRYTRSPDFVASKLPCARVWGGSEAHTCFCSFPPCYEVDCSSLGLWVAANIGLPGRQAGFLACSCQQVYNAAGAGSLAQPPTAQISLGSACKLMDAPDEGRHGSTWKEEEGKGDVVGRQAQRASQCKCTPRNPGCRAETPVSPST